MRHHGRMDTDDSSPGSFASFWLLYRLIFGPLAWPVVLANAVGLAWCFWVAARHLPAWLWS